MSRKGVEVRVVSSVSVGGKKVFCPGDVSYETYVSYPGVFLQVSYARTLFYHCLLLISLYHIPVPWSNVWIQKLSYQYQNSKISSIKGFVSLFRFPYNKDNEGCNLVSLRL